MSNILYMDDSFPYQISEVICISCKERFICSRPEEILLKNLECKCGAMGFIIETGEDLNKAGNMQPVEYIRGKLE